MVFIRFAQIKFMLYRALVEFHYVGMLGMVSHLPGSKQRIQDQNLWILQVIMEECECLNSRL